MLINKKKIVIFLMLILVTISTISYGTNNGVITGETVKLRQGASLEAKLIMLLSVNDKVEVLGQEGDWYKVKYKDNTGYVYKDYVKVEETKKEEVTNNNVQANTTNENNTINENTVTSENNTTNDVIDTQNQVNAENTNTTATETVVENNTEIIVPSEKMISEDTTIKILPLIHSSDIANGIKDSKVTVLEYKNGWAYIVSSNASGWIRKEKLKDVQEVKVEKTEPEETTEIKPEEKPEDSQNEKEPETKVVNKKAYVNVKSVRVRKEPNTSSEVIDSLILNNEVNVIGEQDTWYKVKVNGKEGYMAKQYLSDKPVEVTDRSSNIDRTAKVENSNNDNNTTAKELNETQRTNTTTNTTKGSSIVEYARTFLGNKYVSGGSTPSSGFDCSGFTCYVYKHFGYTLNRSSSAQAKNGVEVSKSELQLGDLVLFSQGSKAIGHVGIYIGNNEFIHAANEDKGVTITSLSNSYYKQRYVTARRIIK